MLEIPNYKIDKELGSGGMSTVYLATHTILDRQVALKIMSPSYLSNDGFKDCFINEGKIISKLDHPNIVHIYDIGISNDACYMAIELLEDDTLRQKIDNKTLSFHEIEKVITQVASALNAAHSQKFIHRDIKPRNILFRKNGDAVLTDFGISKIQNTEGDLTSLGYIAGTPAYMPPEFSLGKELDHRGDIYSLGIVFYEMLTGNKPYQAKTAAAISYEHVNSPIPRLEPNLARYQSIIDRALAKKPQDRFDSTMEFVKAVEIANSSFDETVISTRNNTDSATVIFTHPNTLLAQKEPTSHTDIPDQHPIRLLIFGGVTGLILLAVGVGSYLNFFNTTKNIDEPDPKPIVNTPIKSISTSNLEQNSVLPKEITTPTAHLIDSQLTVKPLKTYPELPDIPPLNKPEENNTLVSNLPSIKERDKPKKTETLTTANTIHNEEPKSDKIDVTPVSEVTSIPEPRKPNNILKSKAPDTPIPSVVITNNEAAPHQSPSIEIDKPQEITVAQLDAPTQKTEVLNNDQKIIIASLLDNCFVRAISAIKEHIRITKNKAIIKDIQNLKMDSGRTKFITDTRRQMQISQVRFDDNISIYYENLTKLKAYKAKNVQDQLTVTKSEHSNKQINQDIADILAKHSLKMNAGKLTLETSKEDFANYANNILNSF